MPTRQFSRTALDLLVKADRPAAPVFVRDGRYQVRTIMREAVKIARKGKATGLAWTERMRVGLRLTWAKARLALAAAKGPQTVRTPVEPRAALAHVARRPSRSIGWDRGVRAATHVW